MKQNLYIQIQINQKLQKYMKNCKNMIKKIIVATKRYFYSILSEFLQKFRKKRKQKFK